MNNFFVVPREGWKERLVSGGIEVHDFHLDGPGLLIPESSIREALTLLAQEIEHSGASGYEGITAITLKDSTVAVPARPAAAEAPATPTTPEVTVEAVSVAEPAVAKKGKGKAEKFETKIDEYWPGKKPEAFKKVVDSIFTPSIKKNVFMHMPHQQVADPIERDGEFHIFLWSSPKGSNTVECPNTMFALPVIVTEKAYPPSGKGLAILDESGFAAAEIVGNNLYIHHDIAHMGTNAELELFSAILNAVLIESSSSPDERRERQDRMRREKMDASKKAFVNICMLGLDKNISETKKQAENAEAKMTEHYKQYVENHRTASACRVRAEALTKVKDGDVGKFETDFETLRSTARITDMTITKDKIMVATETTYFNDPRTRVWHEAGRFRIEIYPDGSNRGVKWYNMDRQVDAYAEKMHAPHVFHDGRACMGNADPMFAELLATNEFGAVILLAIQFVESVNVDDPAGSLCNRWPKAPEDVATRLSKEYGIKPPKE